MKNLFASKKPNTSPSDEAARILIEVDKINAALSSADRELSQAESALLTARSECGKLDAEAALGAIPVTDAYQPVRNAQDGAERVRIKIAALSERLRLRISELRTLAEGPLQELEGQIASRYRVEWLARFRKAASALRECIAEGIAVDRLLNLGMAGPLVTARLDDPEMSGQNLLGLYEGFAFSKSATDLDEEIDRELRIIKQAKAAIAVKEASTMPERTRPDVVPSVYTLSKVS